MYISIIIMFSLKNIPLSLFGGLLSLEVVGIIYTVLQGVTLNSKIKWLIVIFYDLFTILIHVMYMILSYEEGNGNFNKGTALVLVVVF